VRLEFPGAVPGTNFAYDLNDRGNIVGEYRDADGTRHGFHYEQQTAVYGSLGAGVTPRGVNDLDEIVGVDQDGTVGLYWSSPADVPTPLPPLAGHTHSRATAINNAGIIIGVSAIPQEAPLTPGYRAIVAWRVDANGNVSAPVPLPFPADDLRGQPFDLAEQLNGVTMIVGSTGDAAYPKIHAVQWSVEVDGSGELSLLTGPTVLSSDYAAALGVDNSGDVVGDAVSGDDPSAWPFLKIAGQPVQPLPGLSKAASGSAVDINDSGLIVGWQVSFLQGQGAVERAVLWTSPTKVIDLNRLVSLGAGDSLEFAHRINSRGDILAAAHDLNTPCLLIAK
jgi:hypothetical protein